ncbi:MAG: hypothetical protein QOE31_3891 [Solirubrobacteraceae bacterium]|nr:hypothetical protein [Solirubrobacteraceae bacterium]
MHGWIEPFFERAQPAIEPGHIWSGQPIALPPRHGLKIGRVDAKDDAKLDFVVTGRGDETFDHAPIHSLGLSSAEALVLARATRNQPVIVLGVTTGAIASAGAGAVAGASATTEPADDAPSEAGIAFVVPLHPGHSYGEPTRRGVARYEFANAFYLPACERPRFDESVARLDHAQPVQRSDLTGHRGLKLSGDALDALVEWFVAFTTNRLPDDSLILEYRRQQLAGG